MIRRIRSPLCGGKKESVVDGNSERKKSSGGPSEPEESSSSSDSLELARTTSTMSVETGTEAFLEDIPDHSSVSVEVGADDDDFELDSPPSDESRRGAVATTSPVTSANGPVEAVLQDKDCPICCGVLSVQDQMYVMHCPTKTCHFNYCSACIRNMAAAEQDGYQLASDGSRQVKVSIQCPQCRSKYQSENCKYSAEVILDAVILLRKTATLQPFMSPTLKDSELCASILNRKRSFLQQVSLDMLQDAYRRYQEYITAIDKDANSLPPPEWKLWLRWLQPSSSNHTNVSKNLTATTGGNNNKQKTQRPPRFLDQTLLQGLQDFMTPEEQEFVTSLYITGDPEKLAQAAHILHGILQMPEQAAATVQQLSTFSTVSPRRTKRSQEELQRLRGRFPLPLHMPRAVAWPLSPNEDPLASLKLADEKKTEDGSSSALEITSIRGVAGRLGLRKGDIVTHCQGELVHSQAQLSASLMAAYPDTDVLLVVNANQQTARTLVERAEKMKKAGVCLRPAASKVR